MNRYTNACCGAVLLAALGLSGCGGTAGGGRATGPLTNIGATASNGRSTGPALPACTTADLRVLGVQQTPTTNDVYLEVLVTPQDGVSCSLDGYPQVALYGAGGKALPEAPVHQAVNGTPPMGVSPLRVDLTPTGGTTAALFIGLAQHPSGAGGCQSATDLEFTMPGSDSWTGEVSVAAQSGLVGGGAHSVTACGSSMTVSVFQFPILVDLTG